MKYIVIFAIILSSCKGVVYCPTYSYKYKELSTGEIKEGNDWVLYLPKDTVVFFPSGREVVIVETSIGVTTLK
jgi:hypothetical protein